LSITAPRGARLARTLVVGAGAIRLKGERDEEWRAARFECFAERSSGRV
jgi:hypothetical protein